MKLFFSKALGGDTDTACVSCHHPALGGGDNLSLPIGVGAVKENLLGPGREHSSAAEGYDGGPTVPRNAPTTFNIALWDAFMFHDGRVENLSNPKSHNGKGDKIRTPDAAYGTADPKATDLTQAQARFPVTSKEEMLAGFMEGKSNAAIRRALANRLVNQTLPNKWLDEFRIAFNDPNGTAEELINFENIVTAIAEYERSQIFINNPWKTFLEGDEHAITNAAKHGALLFLREVDKGGAGCAACHISDFFTDEKFHVLAIPQIGRGKGDGINGSNDFGRFRETGKETDRFAFRTPTLLNISVTAPYGHDGAYASLEEIVIHHLDPTYATSPAIYDYNMVNLQPGIRNEDAIFNTAEAIFQLETLQSKQKSLLPKVSLTRKQVAQLVAFLETLTDPCVLNRACIGAWIPDTSDSGPDGLQLNAVDIHGNKL
jgi:cytochrome c peroxidase